MMATYDLTTLTEVVRRLGNDMVKTYREPSVSDGSGSLTLNNDGDITLTSVTVDGDVQDSGDYSLSSNVVVFDFAPTANAAIVVLYTRSQYTDTEIENFVLDAARMVQGDLDTTWLLDRDAKTINDVNSEFYVTARSDWRAEIEQLLYMRSAMVVRESLTQQAADDAILIRDGDTIIDTSKAAAAQAKQATGMLSRYDAILRDVQQSRFTGLYT
jgi:hypothetical protein